MSIKRRQYRAEEKVSILKLHLVEKKPVSEVCEQFGLAPNLFYRWQQEFFQNGTAAFEQRRERPPVRLERKISELETKLTLKNEVLAELMEEHIALKKSLGVL